MELDEIFNELACRGIDAREIEDFTTQELIDELTKRGRVVCAYER